MYAEQPGFLFPDEFAPPKKKAKDEYGLQAAQAMYHNRNRYGYGVYEQYDDLNALIELAQGRQSTSNIRRMFGFYGDQGATGSDNGSLAYVDIQVINLATKYINRTVSKLQKQKYKVGLSVIDPISVDEAKEYEAKIKAYYALKDYYETVGVQAQQMFEDINVETLPEYPEEMLFNLSVNQKIRKVIDGEKTLQLVSTTINDLGQVMREFDWDMTVIGRGHLHCYLDANNLPKVERINPKYWGGSYVDNEDFKKQEYAFFIEFITKNQFKKEAEDKLSKEDINHVLTQNSWPNAPAAYGNVPDYIENFDGLDYIPVMRFYFLSNDHRAYSVWKNQYGNEMMDERKYEYTPKGSKKEQDVIKNVYTTVYGGTWVIDSQIVYNYGPKNIPRSNLVDARLPIITFAPNMKNGRYVSLLSQMVEPLTMINVAWNKIKSILAKERLGILDINLGAIEEVAMGKGGEKWSVREVVDFLFQTNISISRKMVNQYNQNVGKNIEFTSTGISLTDYFNTINQCIIFLNDLSGATLAETTNIPDRMTSKTMMANVAAGDDAIEYLINGHVQAYHQASHMLLLLTQEAKRNKATIRGMIPALGKSTTEFFEVPDDLPYCDYGLMIGREATPEEWAEFYLELRESLVAGKINHSDSAYIREVTDMTMARFVLANREKINEMKGAKLQAEERQFQFDIAAKANEDKVQGEMAILDKKKADEMELMVLQGKIDEHLIDKEARLKAENDQTLKTIEERIKKDINVATIVKEAMRSKSEDYKTESQALSKLATARMQADKAKEKPKKVTK